MFMREWIERNKYILICDIEPMVRIKRKGNSFFRMKEKTYLGIMNEEVCK